MCAQNGLAEYDDLEGIAWRWQSINGAMMKAPLAQESAGANPTTDRGKNGSKRHLLVDGRGVPLSLVVTGANRHDVSHRSRAGKDRGKADNASQAPLEALMCGAGYTGEPALQLIERGMVTFRMS